jgi:hypothetical protein
MYDWCLYDTAQLALKRNEFLLSAGHYVQLYDV